MGFGEKRNGIRMKNTFWPDLKAYLLAFIVMLACLYGLSAYAGFITDNRVVVEEWEC